MYSTVAPLCLCVSVVNNPSWRLSAPHDMMRRPFLLGFPAIPEKSHLAGKECAGTVKPGRQVKQAKVAVIVGAQWGDEGKVEAPSGRERATGEREPAAEILSAVKEPSRA